MQCNCAKGLHFSAFHLEAAVYCVFCSATRNNVYIFYFRNTLFRIYFCATIVCSISGIDIYFVLDESGSVGFSNYQLMKQFVYDTVNGFDIGPDDTQVGVISYSDFGVPRFYLNTYHDKAALLTAINNLPYNYGGTNTAAALDLLRQQGYTEANGGRPLSQAVPRVAVVITDGQSNDPSATANAATSVHDEGITVFSVGVGSGFNITELEAIASDPSFVSALTDFNTSQFEALQTTISNEACTSELTYC